MWVSSWWVVAVWQALTGEDDMPLLVGCIAVYSLAFVACLALQRSLRLILPPTLYSYAADFCFTMVVCAYPYSHGTVRDLHGHLGFVVACVVMVTLSVVFFEGSPSPLSVFERFLSGREKWWSFALRVTVQTLGALMAYRLVYAIWSLEVTKEHRQLLRDSACESDLRVPVGVGVAVELGGVMFDTWLSQQRLAKSLVLDTAIKITNAAIMVCAGYQLTGMYMHPAMASGMSFNCKGTDTFEHIIVYWVAAFVGCYAGLALNSVFHLPSSLTVSGAGDASAKKTSCNDKSNNNNNNNALARKKAKKTD